MDQSSTVLPLASLSSNLVQLEQLLRQRNSSSQSGEALSILRDLRRDLDQINFLYDTARRLGQNLALREALNVLVDTLWRRRYSFVVILLGETELGPYVYHEMRGVVDPLPFLGKECPLPLWGELAHALVRRLDPAEPDYVIISDLANSGRPKPQEFPWLEHAGSLMIVPLRKDHVAMGALLLGRRETGAFAGVESCAELVEIARAAAMSLYNAQVRQDLQDRADQLVALQLFTRALPVTEPLCELLVATATGIAELLAGVEVFVLILGKHLPDVAGEVPRPHYVHLPWTGLCILSNRPQPGADVLHISLHRLVMWTIEAGQPLFFDPKQAYSEPEDLYYNEAGPALLVPLASGEDALGAILTVARDPSRQFEESDMVVVRTMANMAAAIIRLRLAPFTP